MRNFLHRLQQGLSVAFGICHDALSFNDPILRAIEQFLQIHGGGLFSGRDNRCFIQRLNRVTIYNNAADLISSFREFLCSKESFVNITRTEVRGF